MGDRWHVRAGVCERVVEEARTGGIGLEGCVEWRTVARSGTVLSGLGETFV